MASQVSAAISRINSGTPISINRTIAPCAVSINVKSARCASATGTCEITASGPAVPASGAPVVAPDPLLGSMVVPAPSAATSTVPTSS